MAQNMKENGYLGKTLKMEEEYKSGQMGQDMMAIGRIIELVEEGDLSILIKTYMKVIGKMTKLTDSDDICIWTGLVMKDFGKMIHNMDLERKSGLMVLLLKENI